MGETDPNMGGSENEWSTKLELQGLFGAKISANDFVVTVVCMPSGQHCQAWMQRLPISELSTGLNQILTPQMEWLTFYTE